jgi:predicted ATP-grasp superfamily ATP-dependent carboligase
MSSRGSREKVLVFGDDMRIFLAVVRSLGRAGKEVHAAPFNWHAPALRSKYITSVHRLPRYSDGPTPWRDAVLSTLRAHAFDLIIGCCDDRTILPFHLHQAEFAEFPIAIPNSEAVGLLFDKERTRALCTELAIPIAAGGRLDAGDTADGLARRLGLPLVLKPRRSYWIDQLDAWGKVWVVDTVAELALLLRTLEKPSRYLAESFFEGAGVGVSVLARDGKILQAFQHRRLREGRGGSSSYRISEPVHDELRQACQRICASTTLTGICMFEFRYNRSTGKWVLLETNARFWGSSPLPIALGVDFPLQLFDLLVHGIEHAPVSYRAGVRSRNMVLDAFNLIASIPSPRSGRIGAWLLDVKDFLGQPLRWLRGNELSDGFVRDDFGPGIWELGTVLQNVSQKVTGKSGELRRRLRERHVAA